MCEDKSGNLWIGTANGLNVYLYEKDRFVVFRHMPENERSIISNNINAIISDKNGNIWIGTDKGADKLSVSGQSEIIEKIQHYHSGNQSGSLSGENVLSIYEDPEGRIWMGTDNGLNLLDEQHIAFMHYLHNPQDPGTRGDREICGS